MSRTLLQLTGLLIVLLLLGAVAAWWAGTRTTPHGKPLIEAPPVTVADCDLQRGACTATPGEGTLSLNLSPRPVRALERFEIEVQIEGLPVQAVAVAFTGVDMYMGHNRVRLEAAGDGRYVGEGTLPVCVTGRMTWEAAVIVEGYDAVRAVPFQFELGAR